MDKNGYQSEENPRRPIDEQQADLLEASLSVQRWLEQAYLWLLGMGDLTSARALVPVVESVVTARQEIVDTLLETAEAEQARLLVEGG